MSENDAIQSGLATSTSFYDVQATGLDCVSLWEEFVKLNAVMGEKAFKAVMTL